MRAALLRLIAIPFALSLLMAPPTSAETGVEAVVCTGDSQPTLNLLPDINDSTLRVNTVEITGVVERVSAVDVYVDSEYDHTIAIPANETAFATSVRLAIGTHTLRIEAVGICSGNNATKEVVVTIIPWNYGFAVATNGSEAEVAPSPGKEESSGETLDEVLASSSSTQQQAAGLFGVLQTLFPEASPKEVILATVLMASTTLTFLPSSVLTQAAAGQVIAGRRMLFIALLPVMGVFCLTLSS